MTIAFAKVPKSGIDFSLKSDNVLFCGKMTKQDDTLVKCTGKIQGFTPYLCDRCGDEFSLELDEIIEVLVSDGIINLPENRLENVVEFFDGQIQLEEIFLSEIESIKSDYFYCKKCT